MNWTRSFSRQVLRPNPILYADKAIVAVNKPSGVSCQPSTPDDKGKENAEASLASLIEGCRRQLKDDCVLLPVHRLDKLATGVLLFARSPTFAAQVSQQFQGRTVQKSYLAIVRGGRKTFPEAGRGTIDVGIDVSKVGVKLSNKTGRVALTEWELLGSSDTVPLSLLRLTLHSGIKHQLRVHLAGVLNCPILGDSLYSSKPPPLEVQAVLPPHVIVHPKQAADIKSPSFRTSMFLHSSRLSLFRYNKIGPDKRVRLGITAPIPQDFLVVCETSGLRQYLTDEDERGGLDIDGCRLPDDETIPVVNGRWLAE